jgi:hypothetical protein
MHPNLVNPQQTIPPGYCHCGCRRLTTLATKTCTKRAVRKGDRLSYLPGHSPRNASLRYTIDPITACWNWQRKINPQWGYGSTSQDGQTVLAHRAMYEAYKGQIPEGLELDHRCENPRCVNPDHLEPTTTAENVRRSKRCKVTIAIANEIRARYAQGDISQHALARQYPLSQTMISHIVNNLAWI